MIDYRNAYAAAGELDNGVAALRWGADWILKVIQKIKRINRFDQILRTYVKGYEIGPR